jgi:predicted RNA-binding Zn-ribbon protein involved in translation (DUF1610 family)
MEYSKKYIEDVSLSPMKCPNCNSAKIMKSGCCGRFAFICSNCGFTVAKA